MSQISNEKQNEFNETFFSEPKTRRSAIKTIASGMTIASLSACSSIRKPPQIIQAYATEQSNMIVGKPTYYATSAVIGNNVEGMLVTTHEGRPIKLDGNPNHPNNMGASNAHIQAEILNLYDPDRLKESQLNNTTAPLESVLNALLTDIKSSPSKTVILMNDTESLVHDQLIRRINQRYPGITFLRINALRNDNERVAIKALTGTYGYVNTNYRETSVILNFNKDFLGTEQLNVSTINEFMDKKQTRTLTTISCTSSLTTTDSAADEVISLSIPDQELMLKAIAADIINVYKPTNYKKIIQSLGTVTLPTNLMEKKSTIVPLLIKNRGKSTILIGAIHSPDIHKIGLYLNRLLKNSHKSTVIHSDLLNYSKRFRNNTTNEAIQLLTDKASKKTIKTLVSIGFDMNQLSQPLLHKLSDASIYSLSSYKPSHVPLKGVIPKTHFLEEWDLLLSKEGHLSIVQPVIQPLGNRASIATVLSALSGSTVSDYNHVKNHLQQASINMSDLLRKGVQKNYRNPQSLFVNQQLTLNTPKKPSEKTLTIIPSNSILDGRYSNNAWLQETPDPFSKLTWGNALYIHTDYAKQLGIKTGRLVHITLDNNQSFNAPVIILPGQNKSTLTISMGYNQMNGTFSEYGTSVQHISSTISNGVYGIASVEPLNETVVLADTQMNHGLDEETLAASGINDRINHILTIKSVNELTEHHDDHHDTSHHIHSLFKEQTYHSEYQWGMTIDLDRCMGCNACSVACQSENNIPIVGKTEVIKGREMSWIRTDRYFKESDGAVNMHFQPVACVHCENAPCEQVCPVNATVHDDEGLNVMTYNRCIGTRYCANNCPYKVRRFNFFDWHQKNPQSTKKNRIHLFDYFREPSAEQQMQFNPEVTVRMRGVMEKCTYCIQRLKTAKIDAKVNNDPSIIDSIQTACQQACPSTAIQFGNIKNTTLKSTKLRSDKRSYLLLQKELNTKPRTVYLCKITNPVWSDRNPSHQTKGTTHGHS